jgi:hypothetical protein
MPVIYVLKDPETLEVRYVGFTRRALKYRLTGHIADVDHKPHLRKSRWLGKILSKGLHPLVEVIEELQETDDWEEAEKRQIAYFREQGCNLTNLTDGGQSTNGWLPTIENRKRMSEGQTSKPRTEKQLEAMRKLHEFNTGKIRSIKIPKPKKPRPKKTEEQKRRHSELLKGHVVSEETRRKISLANKGKKLTEEQIRKTTEKNRGRKRTEEFCKRQSEYRKGKPMSEETKRKLSAAKIGKKCQRKPKEKCLVVLVENN